MSVDRQRRVKCSPLTGACKIQGNIDLPDKAFPSLELGDVKSSMDNFPQIDCKSPSERNESAKEPRRRYKWNREKSCEDLQIINLDEVAWHDTPDDCWLVIYDYVYDCTECARSHPGGQDVLLEYAGRDATLAFIGTGHSAFARKSLERYLIGELPPEERIFRVPGGVKVLGF